MSTTASTRPLSIDQEVSQGSGPKIGGANVLGVRVSMLGVEETAGQIVSWARQPMHDSGPRYVCATSVHGIMEAYRDPDFRGILNDAAVITPDGMPLVWVGHLRGCRGMTRVYGPALMKRVCSLSEQFGLRHFLYGGAAGVPEQLASRLATEFPDLGIAGAYSPPFRPLTPEEQRAVAERINESNADIVWVGLSTPKQERWVASIAPELQCKVIVTVGAAFDFHTGRVRQAPGWVQRVGLEWLFRLTQEPRRLWRRYLSNIPKFLGLVLLQLTRIKKFSSD